MRRILVSLMALLLTVSVAACGGTQPDSGTPQSGDKVKVAALFTQKVTEGNWDPPGFAAFKKMAEKQGFEYAYAESVDYSKTGDVLRDFASRGYQLIIAHSSGYGSGVLEVAPEFPDTKFVVVSALDSTGDHPNVAGWAFQWIDVGYMAGLVAGYASPTGNLGLVHSEVIPAFTKATAGFIEGAKHANPDAKVKVAWIGSFTDAAKAKQLALAQVAEGVDFFFPMADTAALGVFEAAKEKNLFAIGSYVDQSQDAPDVIATSMLMDFDRIYDEIGQQLKDGTLEAKVNYLSAKDGYFKFAPFKHLSDETIQKVEAAMDQIESGELQIPQDIDYKAS